MRKFWTASVAAMAFTLMAAPASAQAPWSTAGELTDNDSVADGQNRYDDHTLQLQAGQRYRISVDSSAFDPVARLYRPGSTAAVAYNDDGDGLNSRINYTPTESGTYTLRVLAFSADGRGAYTAGVAELPPLPPGVPVPWSTSGRIETSDPTAEAGHSHDDEAPATPQAGPHYDEYTLRLEAGQRYILKVESSAFDPVARLYRSGETDVIAENDDSDGLNSRIFFAPTETGNYTLRVVPLSNDGTGAYRASAEIAPPLPAPITSFTGMSTTVWKVYSGALTNTDGESATGARVDDYLIHFNAGQERIIALDSADFDSVVQVLALDQRDAGEPLASNDDSGGTLNSLMSYKPDTAGDYIVRVTSFSNEGRGRYRLRVSE